LAQLAKLNRNGYLNKKPEARAWGFFVSVFPRNQKVKGIPVRDILYAQIKTPM
jgi:hypothetical protein